MKLYFRPKFRTKGFTLIEILLYLGIFGLIISTIMSLSAAALSARIKNQVVADTNYQGEAVLGLITQTIRGASSVTTPALGTSSTSLKLVMPNPATSPTTFDASSDGSIIRARISEGTAGTLNFLTNSHVTVSNLSFVNAGANGSDGSIKIQFTLSYNNPSGRSEYSYSHNFFGTANLP